MEEKFISQQPVFLSDFLFQQMNYRLTGIIMCSLKLQSQIAQKHFQVYENMQSPGSVVIFSL